MNKTREIVVLASPEEDYIPAYNLENQTEIMNRIQAQNLLTAVHQQFHQNQGKYIDLLSKVIEHQAVLLEQHQNSSVYPRGMQNLEQILQILQNNQLNYNANHEGYLQSQLALIRGEEFTPHTTSTLNDSSALRVPNYPISDETALPPSTQPERQNIDASARQSASSMAVPLVKEQLPEVPSSSNGMNDDLPHRVPNYPISETEMVLPSTKPEEQKSIHASASQSASSAPATISPKAILKPIIITSETISHPVQTEKLEKQNSIDALASQSASSTPAQVTVSPKSTPTLDPVTTISENITHSVESTFGNGSGNTVSTTSVDVTKLSKRLLEVVSDKTGYPVDMLDVNMDLEADLGIDSIKQVQIFATVQEEFSNIELDTEMLGELRTIAQIIEYMKEHLSADKAAPPSDELHEHETIERQLVKKNY